jgi:paired amphipathic helix protein Sin3a
LEILHAYQEKRATDGAIEQVKAQVEHLFRGHPDLLDDFNYFLPPESGAWPVKKAPKVKKKRSADKISRKLLGDSQRLEHEPPVRAVAGGRRGPAPTGVISVDSVPLPPDSKQELQLFEKIKTMVPKALYVQFLRCLNLYSNNIVTRAELVTLVEDLFNTIPKFSDLSAKFKDIIGYNEWEENQLMTHLRSNFYAFVSSVDFTTCKQVTPSYRELPKEVPIPPCSGRTVLGDAVLNDTCISIPTGTEDQSFKSSRKNQYEEALFRVEDERYEVHWVPALCILTHFLCLIAAGHDD